MTHGAEPRPEADQFGGSFACDARPRASRKQQLADIAGVSVRYVSAIEAGDNSPSLSAIFAFCEARGTSPAALLEPILRQRKR